MSNSAVGMPSQLEAAAMQDAMIHETPAVSSLVSPVHVECHDTAQGTWSSKLRATHAARAPGSFWISAAGCALAEAYKVPFADASDAGAWGTAEALGASCARRCKVGCDVSTLSAVCMALLLHQAVRQYACLWSYNTRSPLPTSTLEKQQSRRRLDAAQ